MYAVPYRTRNNQIPGAKGKHYSNIPGLVGMLPQNFTDQAWQGARTDGELMWILKNGSPGSAMPPSSRSYLTEQEGRQVLLYVRAFGR